MAVNFASLLVFMHEGAARLSKPALQVWLFLVFLGIGFFFQILQETLKEEGMKVMHRNKMSGPI